MAVGSIDSWLSSQGIVEFIKSLHDHLKVHQFKFERNEHGEYRIYYKEWSLDDPKSGLGTLPEGIYLLIIYHAKIISLLQMTQSLRKLPSLEAML